MLRFAVMLFLVNLNQKTVTVKSNSKLLVSLSVVFRGLIIQTSKLSQRSRHER